MKSIISSIVVLVVMLLINTGLYLQVDMTVYVLNSLFVVALLANLYLLCSDVGTMKAHVTGILLEYKKPSIGELCMSGVVGLVSIPCIPLLMLGGYYKTLAALLVVSWVALLFKNRMNAYVYSTAKFYLK